MKPSYLTTETIILKTFQEDLTEFKKTQLSIQTQVGKNVFEDIQLLSQLTIENLNRVVPQLREKYKSLRHQAINNGANNELNPDYAYAAIMESAILAIGRDNITQQVMGDIIAWLTLIGVVKK